MRIVFFALLATMLITPLGLLAVDECPNNRTVSGDPMTMFGCSIASIGDIGSPESSTPDGYDDFIVGAYMYNEYMYDLYRGRVVVYSGKDASVIRIHLGYKANSQMGYSVSHAGDFNGDQWPDYVVGSPGEKVGQDDECGRVTVYSGKDGSELMSFPGFPGEKMGFCVSGIGNLNAAPDICDDVIVGCPEYDLSGVTHGGRIVVFEGFEDSDTTGPAQHQIEGTKTNQQFGYRVSGVGDIDNDNTVDFIVGCASDTVRVYSGQTWRKVLLTAPASKYISDAGYINDDDRADFVVGYPSSNQAVVYSGYASFYNGQTATVLRTLTDSSSTYLGWEVANAGLVTNDTIPDILVSEMGSAIEPPKAHLFSGADGSLAFTQVCGSQAGIRISIACAGDIGLDGRDNIMVGHHGESWVKVYTCTDSDEDGWFDIEDNCPDDFNPDQANEDLDDFGDVCDDCEDDPYQCCWPGGRVGGDANGDGWCDTGDAVYIMNYVYKNGPEPIPFRLAGDANGDLDVNVGDAVYIIAYVFKGGPAPVNGCPEDSLQGSSSAATAFGGIETGGGIPNTYCLYQNTPNPFNPVTTIRVGIPAGHDGVVSLRVYNVSGQLVKTIFEGTKTAGIHTFEWDATNSAGQPVSTGIYFSRFTAGDVSMTRKMILLK